MFSCLIAPNSEEGKGEVSVRHLEEIDRNTGTNTRKRYLDDNIAWLPYARTNMLKK